MFKTALRQLGHVHREIGLHTLRSGDITSVVNHCESDQFSERMLKIRGGWKPDIAKDMYVLESESNRFNSSYESFEHVRL